MTLAGNVRVSDLGRYHLIICNRKCRIEEYISFGLSTQCRSCQQYGHPAACCKNSPACAVCAGAHKTKSHPCNLPNCKKGPACTHPPIHCLNCNDSHKASDPNCPVRIKLRAHPQNNMEIDTANNQGDAPQVGVAV